MKLLRDIKEEWTKKGIKKSMREEWPTLLAVAIAGFLTPVVVKKMGWQESNLAFFLVNVLMIVLAGIVVGGIKRICNRKEA